MSQYIFGIAFPLIAALACWYCHRWGKSDGHAEGYEAGLAKGRIEGSGTACPSGVGGPGPVPR